MPLYSILLAGGIVSAGEPGLPGALGALMDEHGVPEIAVACAPVGDMVARLRESLLADPLARLPSGAGAMLVDPAAAAVAGLDLDGVAAAALDPDTESGWFVLPFSGDADAATALLTDLSMSPVRLESGGWELMSGRAEGSLSGGRLLIRVGGPLEGNTLDPGMLTGLPDQSGCVAWIFAPEEGTRSMPIPFGRMQGAAFVPLERGQEIILRVKLADPPPPVLARPSSAPVGGSTSEPPTLVFALGVSLRSLLEDPTIAEAIDLEQRQARRAVRAFDVEPGTTLATFGEPDPKDLDWVAVLPMAKDRPNAIARRAARVLRRLEMDVERSGPSAFVATVEERTFYGAAASGRLVIGSSPARVTEAAGGAGRSWLEGANLDRLQGWPIAFWTGAGATPAAGWPQDFSVDLGLRANAGMWEMGLLLQGGPDLLRMLLQRGAGSDLKALNPAAIP